MSKLRPNCPVGINQTWRDNEYQNWLFAQGRTRPGNIVTHAQGSFSPHNYRVAFDIHKNIRGHEFSDISFFNDAGRIWVEMGGVWGGNFRSFVARPHFEFTGGLTIAEMRNGRTMPQDTKMPWESEEEMSQEMFNEMMKVYLATQANQPESPWAMPLLKKAVDAKITDGQRPRSFATREEVAVMVLNATKLKGD
jgi:peptidoglycan L-alanyl-D-glutamate endopeptidase CwlK